MSIKRRGKTKIWWTDFTAPDGKRIRASTGTTNKREAKELEAQMKSEQWRIHKLGEKVKVRHSWQEATIHYLRIKEDMKWKRGVTECLRDLHQWIGDKYLDEINEELISNMMVARKSMLSRTNRNKGKPVSNATVNRMLSILRAVLKQAEKLKWIDRAPVVELLPEKKHYPRALTMDEIIRLKGELPSHLKPMMEFAVLTGLRMSNVTGLAWRNVKFETSTLEFNADEVKNSEPFSVPLNQSALDILKAELGKHDTYVFTYQHKPIKNANTRAFKKAVTRAGIESLCWHDLRHTFATLHRLKGTPLDVIQELGGWKSEQMVKRYAHINAEYLIKHVASISIG